MNKELKLKWIEALDETIALYNLGIKRECCYLHIRLLHNNGKWHLCELAKEGCPDCIHFTNYSQGKTCGDQKSYKPYSTDTKRLIIRRSYLIRVRNKLRADL